MKRYLVRVIAQIDTEISIEANSEEEAQREVEENISSSDLEVQECFSNEFEVVEVTKGE